MKRNARPLVGTLLIVLLLLAGCYPPSIIPSGGGVAPLPEARLLATPPTAIPVPDLAATVVAISPGEVRNSLPSPDGRWRVDLVAHPCVQTAEGMAAFDELRLLDLSAGTSVVFANQLYLCEGLGAFGLDVRTWSANGRFVYYTDAREGGPDGACAPWLPPILRLDPLTLAIEKLEGAAASSQQNRVVGMQGAQVVVWDSETGELGRLALRASWTAVQFAWSPDGSAFAYLQSEQTCPTYGRSGVTLVVVDGMGQTALLDSDRGFGGLHWEEPGVLVLSDAQEQELRLNVATGELR